MTLDLKRFSTFLLLTGLAFVSADLISSGVEASCATAPRVTVQAGSQGDLNAHLSADDYVTATCRLFTSPISSDKLSLVTSTPSAVSPWDDWFDGPPEHSIVLLGTMVRKGMGLALIRVGTANYIVQDGERLGSWKVRSVSDDAMVFARGQEGRTLTLPMLSSNTSLHVPHPDSLPAGSKVSPKVAFRVENGVYIISSTTVRRILDKPEDLFKTARFEPVSKSGKPYGMKVSFTDSTGLFSALGLNQNDVLLAINNNEIRTPDEAYYQWASLQHESSLMLKIDRAGQVQNISVELR